MESSSLEDASSARGDSANGGDVLNTEQGETEKDGAPHQEGDAISGLGPLQYLENVFNLHVEDVIPFKNNNNNDGIEFHDSSFYDVVMSSNGEADKTISGVECKNLKDDIFHSISCSVCHPVLSLEDKLDQVEKVMKIVWQKKEKEEEEEDKDTKEKNDAGEKDLVLEECNDADENNKMEKECGNVAEKNKMLVNGNLKSKLKWEDIKIKQIKPPVDPSCLGNEVVKKIIWKAKPKRRLKVPFTCQSKLPQRLSPEMEAHMSELAVKSSDNVGMVLNIGRQRPLYQEQWENVKLFENCENISSNWAKFAASAVKPNSNSSKVSRLLIPVLCEKLVKLIKYNEQLKKYDKGVEYGIDKDADEKYNEVKEKKMVKRVDPVVKNVVSKLIDSVVNIESSEKKSLKVVSQSRVGRELKRLNASYIEVEEEQKVEENNFAKVEKEYHQTILKNKDEIIFKNREKRARKRPLKFEGHVLQQYVIEKGAGESSEKYRRTEDACGKDKKTDKIWKRQTNFDEDSLDPFLKECSVHLLKTDLPLTLKGLSQGTYQIDKFSSPPKLTLEGLLQETYQKDECSLPKFNSPPKLTLEGLSQEMYQKDKCSPPKFSNPPKLTLEGLSQETYQEEKCKLPKFSSPPMMSLKEGLSQETYEEDKCSLPKFSSPKLKKRTQEDSSSPPKNPKKRKAKHSGEKKEGSASSYKIIENKKDSESKEKTKIRLKSTTSKVLNCGSNEDDSTSLKKTNDEPSSPISEIPSACSSTFKEKTPEKRCKVAVKRSNGFTGIKKRLKTLLPVKRLSECDQISIDIGEMSIKKRLKTLLPVKRPSECDQISTDIGKMSIKKRLKTLLPVKRLSECDQLLTDIGKMSIKKCLKTLSPVKRLSECDQLLTDIGNMSIKIQSVMSLKPKETESNQITVDIPDTSKNKPSEPPTNVQIQSVMSLEPKETESNQINVDISDTSKNKPSVPPTIVQIESAMSLEPKENESNQITVDTLDTSKNKPSEPPTNVQIESVMSLEPKETESNQITVDNPDTNSKNKLPVPSTKVQFESVMSLEPKETESNQITVDIPDTNSKNMLPVPLTKVQIRDVMSLEPTETEINQITGDVPDTELIKQPNVQQTRIRFLKMKIEDTFLTLTHRGRFPVTIGQQSIKFAMSTLEGHASNEIVYLPIVRSPRNIGLERYFGIYFIKKFPTTAFVGPYQLHENHNLFVRFKTNTKEAAKLQQSFLADWCFTGDFILAFWKSLDNEYDIHMCTDPRSANSQVVVFMTKQLTVDDNPDEPSKKNIDQTVMNVENVLLEPVDDSRKEQLLETIEETIGNSLGSNSTECHPSVSTSNIDSQDQHRAQSPDIDIVKMEVLSDDDGDCDDATARMKSKDEIQIDLEQPPKTNEVISTCERTSIHPIIEEMKSKGEIKIDLEQPPKANEVISTCERIYPVNTFIKNSQAKELTNMEQKKPITPIMGYRRIAPKPPTRVPELVDTSDLNDNINDASPIKYYVFEENIVQDDEPTNVINSSPAISHQRFENKIIYRNQASQKVFLRIDTSKSILNPLKIVSTASTSATATSSVAEPRSLLKVPVNEQNVEPLLPENISKRTATQFGDLLEINEETLVETLPQNISKLVSNQSSIGSNNCLMNKLITVPMSKVQSTSSLVNPVKLSSSSTIVSPACIRKTVKPIANQSSTIVGKLIKLPINGLALLQISSNDSTSVSNQPTGNASLSCSANDMATLPTSGENVGETVESDKTILINPYPPKSVQLEDPDALKIVSNWKYNNKYMQSLGLYVDDED